jgi:hypothetical protein
MRAARTLLRVAFSIAALALSLPSRGSGGAEPLPRLLDHLQVGSRVTEVAGGRLALEIRLLADSEVRVFATPEVRPISSSPAPVAVVASPPETFLMRDGTRYRVLPARGLLTLEYRRTQVSCATPMRAAIQLAGCTPRFCFAGETLTVEERPPEC